MAGGRSPVKGGPLALLGGGGNNIQAILQAAGAAKSNLTAGNKDLMKMNRGNELTEKSVRSGGTRKTGDATTKSRKSRVEEDFENMEIEEIDILIENAEREMKQATDAKKKIQRIKN